MKSQTTTTTGPRAVKINAAHEEAENSKAKFVEKSVICGQMLIEQRTEMSFSHCKKNLPWQGSRKADPDQFTRWLGQNCPKISQATAYRRMAAASRVIAILTETHAGDTQVWIELDGEKYYVSTVLTMPEGDSTEAMRTFRATFSKFLENKTLTEAAAATLCADDEAHRITRAYKGDETGGTNDEDNRKDWPLFCIRKLHDFSVHISHWAKMTETQRTELKAGLRNMICADEVKLHGRPPTKSIVRASQPWPEELCRAAQEALRERLKK